MKWGAKRQLELQYEQKNVETKKKCCFLLGTRILSGKDDLVVVRGCFSWRKRAWEQVVSTLLRKCIQSGRKLKERGGLSSKPMTRKRTSSRARMAKAKQDFDEYFARLVAKLWADTEAIPQSVIARNYVLVC